MQTERQGQAGELERWRDNEVQMKLAAAHLIETERATSKKLEEVQQALFVELDHNSMRKAVIELFNTRLVQVEGQLSSVVSMQLVSLEHLRELSSKISSTPPIMTAAERERRISEYAKTLD